MRIISVLWSGISPRQIWLSTLEKGCHEILLKENADPGEMLTCETGVKRKICYKQKWRACASFLVWWRWRERTSTWPSLLSVFNSFVFWVYLLHGLNCANPQSKLCSLHSCESGGNAEGQFNIDLFLLSPFCTPRKHIRFCACAVSEGVWAGLCARASAEVVAELLALHNPWSNFSVICCTQEHLSC